MLDFHRAEQCPIIAPNKKRSTSSGVCVFVFTECPDGRSLNAPLFCLPHSKCSPIKSRRGIPFVTCSLGAE